MKGAQHKLWAKASSHTHSVASSYKNRAVKIDIGPPRPAAKAERLAPKVKGGEVVRDAQGNPVYPKWTIMHTGPKQEFAAVGELQRDGYAAYCPVITKWMRIGGKRTIRHIPLFPRYVFVGLKDGAKRSLNACKWGRPLALDNGSIPFIPQFIVYGLSDEQEAGVWDEAKAQAIREAEEQRLKAARRKASEFFKTGDMVTIDNDLFDGVGAQIVHAGDDERVIALMNILGRATRVQIALDDIKPAA